MQQDSCLHLAVASHLALAHVPSQFRSMVCLFVFKLVKIRCRRRQNLWGRERIFALCTSYL